MPDLSELLDNVRTRGFIKHFSLKQGRLFDGVSLLEPKKVRLITTEMTDTGTDPGDDATVYLLETNQGLRGFLVLPDGPHTDPEKSQFVDLLVGPEPDI